MSIVRSLVHRASSIGTLGTALVALSSVAPVVAQDEAPAARVRAAVRAMGGETTLRGLDRVHLEVVGHRFMVEQSERPEGPYIPAYVEVEETLDLDDGGLVRVRTVRTPGQAFESGVVVADGVVAASFGERTFPGRPSQLDDARRRLELGPERVLLTALAAADLHAVPDTIVQSVPHHRVGFTWRGAEVVLYLNARTRLPTAIEIHEARPDDMMWNVWGDVVERTWLSYWTLEDGGLRYPRQWDEETNGWPIRTRIVTGLDLDPQLAADAFAIAPEIREAFAARPARTIDEVPLGRPDQPPVEPAEGVVVIPGPWNVALVRQADGIVVLEAPISAGYSRQVLAEAERRFPELPVKAVVSTSDAWPHVGGVREYVARGIPVYALDLNVSHLERIARAPRTRAPDSLARAPRTPDVRAIGGPTSLGTGPNRLLLVPVRGEAGERMMLAHLPGRELLYASDLIQRLPDGSWWAPEYLYETMKTVERAGLAVETVFAMHLGPEPWEAVVEGVAEAIGGSPGPGH